ncbi:MAG: HD domain-containing phosphohydrolase [Halarsenatibacteraceae bacterium]
MAGSKKKRSNEYLDLDIESQQYHRLFHESPAGMLLLDQEGNILKANQAILDITGYKYEEIIHSNIFDLLVKEDFEEEAKNNIDKILSGEDLQHITKTRHKSGKTYYSLLKETRIKLNNGDYGVLSMQIDVTDIKEKEEKIKHISYHDDFTGLYNRKFLEEELNRLDTKRQLPISIIMADIDGLKLINDSYGHGAGDKLIKKAVEILKDSVREEDILARWGGDEFIILLPQTGEKESEMIIKRIIEKTDKTADIDIPISIALGYAVKKEYESDIYKILNKANKTLYHNKISYGRDSESKIVQSLLDSLGSQSGETKEHAQRMAKSARKLGRKLNLSQNQLHKLYLLAYLHDIGKITVPESILNKKGKLTDDEWETIISHTLKGKQIAAATSHFAPIAEEIHSHHERWDGKGYPQELKGDETPYLARIISIVDAYDVMINGRVYQNSLAPQKAIQELKDCAGSQFDPDLVDEFIEVMKTTAVS